MEFEPVIGFEVHAQLATATKIFCGCANQAGGEPNSRVCPVCLGMPGALPSFSSEALDQGIRVALALRATVARRMSFARKNYFYPDLPKGYQITQLDRPLARGGFLDVEVRGVTRRVAIERVHLEEDAGKTTHAARPDGDVSLIDMNRCGVPLIEIVTAPDIRGLEEAGAFLTALWRVLVFLGVSSGRMHEGSMRFDTNVSIRKAPDATLGTQTEIKNLNSFRAVERALACEIARQVDVVEGGGAVRHETLLWDERGGRVVPMRSKEVAPDYRYFPEPDLPDVLVDPARVEAIAAAMPELPTEMEERLAAWYGLADAEADALAAEPGTAVLFELTVREILGEDVGRFREGDGEGHAAATPIDMRRLPRPRPGDELRLATKTACSWITVVLGARLNDRGVGLHEFVLERPGRTSVERYAALAGRLAAILRPRLRGEVSEPAAKRLFDVAIESDEPIGDLIARLDLAQVSDRGVLARTVQEVLDDHPREVERYRAGESRLYDFFMGEVMRMTRGKADPRRAAEILSGRLAEKEDPRGRRG